MEQCISILSSQRKNQHIRADLYGIILTSLFRQETDMEINIRHMAEILVTGHAIIISVEMA